MCKPGLTLVNGICVDLMSSPQSCGMIGNACPGATPRCQNGMCVADCMQPYQECNNACVLTDSDPRHCGNCGDQCANDEVCVQGNCRQWELALGCNQCPCALSCNGDFSQCCGYPNDPTLLICVDAGNCP